VLIQYISFNLFNKKEGRIVEQRKEGRKVKNLANNEKLQMSICARTKMRREIEWEKESSYA
jgi:hypothetical protein